MRLLSAGRLELKTFTEDDLIDQPYAILSHCWSREPGDEVVFEDIGRGTAQARKGYAKVEGCMQQARRDGYDWVWIDTCCIDKSSSSELSEAINSMYAWYAGAAVCYAYIEDDAVYSVAELKDAKWFSRSWTLQELISPRHLVFYNRKWMRLGSKADDGVAQLITRLTGIDDGILKGSRALLSVSVARRMSWAAARQASRREDTAYSLMGLFAVNMPMLYGEGAVNAFHRLQEQIMKDSNDHSIFAWRSRKTDGSDSGRPTHHGLLADSPQDFATSADMIPYDDWEDSPPYQLTNRGLRLELCLSPLDADGTFAAALNCPIPSFHEGYHGFVGLKLRKLPTGVNQYARIACDEVLHLTQQRGALQVLYVRQRGPRAGPDADAAAVMPWHFFALRRLRAAPEAPYELVGAAHYPLQAHEREVAPRPARETQGWVVAGSVSAFNILKETRRLSAALGFRRKADGEQFALLLGCRTNLEVGFDVAVQPEYSALRVLQAGFRPRAPGEWMQVGTHRVKVDVEMKLDTPRKLYLVDITITSTALTSD